MTNQNKKAGQDTDTGSENEAVPAPETTTDIDQQDNTESGTPWAPGDAIDGTADSQDPMALLVEESAKMKDQLLRTLADMENLRQRTAREVKDARSYAISNFARDMLNAGDNMRRALEAVPEEARANADSTLTALLEGVELTERDMHKAFENHGVREINPINERFDPNFHQAMYEVPNPDVGNGTIIEVVQSGYVIGDRVLRPAMVGVAKGGPKTPKVEVVDDPDPIPPKADDISVSAQKQDTADDAQQNAKPDEGSVGSRVDKSA